MGYKPDRLSVTVRLSDHNSDQDHKDRELWQRLQSRIREVVEDPAYAGLEPSIGGW